MPFLETRPRSPSSFLHRADAAAQKKAVRSRGAGRTTKAYGEPYRASFRSIALPITLAFTFFTFVGISLCAAL
jgi:hypothetical protein